MDIAAIVRLTQLGRDHRLLASSSTSATPYMIEPGPGPESYAFLGLGRICEPGKQKNVLERRELPIGVAVVHLPGGLQ